MANQQEENYTKIANEILEHSPKLKLNGTQRGIIEVIWRYTYGFHRDDHGFSLAFLAEATNSNKQQIKRELDKLIKAKILNVTKEADFKNPRRITYNRNYSQWIESELVSANKSTVSELEYSTVSGLEYQERKTKETIKKELPSHEILFEELWKIFPNKKGKSAVTTKSKKVLVKVGRDDLVAAIKKYCDEVKDTDKKYIMHGSTFFNGRYVDYLDKEDDHEEPAEIDLTLIPNDLSRWTD